MKFYVLTGRCPAAQKRPWRVHWTGRRTWYLVPGILSKKTWMRKIKKRQLTIHHAAFSPLLSARQEHLRDRRDHWHDPTCTPECWIRPQRHSITAVHPAIYLLLHAFFRILRNAATLFSNRILVDRDFSVPFCRYPRVGGHPSSPKHVQGLPRSYALRLVGVFRHHSARQVLLERLAQADDLHGWLR